MIIVKLCEQCFVQAENYSDKVGKTKQRKRLIRKLLNDIVKYNPLC